MLRQRRKHSTQAFDDLGLLQPKERVDGMFVRERGDWCRITVGFLHACQQAARRRVRRLTIEGECQIACEIVVSWVDPRRLGQASESPVQGVEQQLGVTAVVAVARTGIEERVATKELRYLIVGQQTEVGSRMSRGVEALELHALSDADPITLAESPIKMCQPARGPGVRQHSRSGGRPQRLVAADVIAMLVGVQDMREGPAARADPLEAGLPVQRVDRQRLAALLAGDQIVEIAPAVGGPKPL